MADRGYRIVEGSKAVVDYGPVYMTISAWSDGRQDASAAEVGARKAISLLEELSKHLSEARKPVTRLRDQLQIKVPETLRRMIDTVSLLGETDFTPMAAVAGIFSDLVKETVLDEGADSVVVNNGGDIALRIVENRSLRVGIVSDLYKGRITHLVEVGPGSALADVEGVATSGLGGRSLTKGVASSVTCFAGNCALADAAATSVANAAQCRDQAVERCLAEEIDRFTDLAGQMVTRRVSQLSHASIVKALEGSLERAGQLINKRMIIGAVVFIQGRMGVLPSGIACPVVP